MSERPRSFREKYRKEILFLDAQMQERFGMTLMEFWEKIQPKDNPFKDDPKFDWHKEQDE